METDGAGGSSYAGRPAKWWGHDRHFVHYWVSRGRELNLVAPVPEATWTEESWTAEAKVGDLLDALSDFPEPVRRIAGAAIRTTSPLADVVAQVLDLAGVFRGDRRAPGSHPGEHRA